MAFLLAYLASCGVAQWLAIVPGTGISLWIPGGCYLAVLLISRNGLWPAAMLVAALAELGANALWFNNPWPVAWALHLGNALGALTGALLVRWLSGQQSFRLETLRDVLILIGVGALLVPAIPAVVGAVTLHHAEGQSLSRSWLLWWLGDATGALIGAPLILIARQLRHGAVRTSARKTLEALALCTALFALGAVSLSGPLPFAYVVTPVLVWAAVSFQFAGAAAAILVLTLITAHFTANGGSPFVGTVETQALHSIMLQLFLAVSAILGLCVAAVSRQSAQALKALSAANADLEERVRARTSDLQAASRHKDVMLALIAHEFRTPLAAMLTGAQVLKHAAHQVEHVQRVQQIFERQGGLLTRLVDDLIDAAAISEGKLTLRVERVDLVLVLTQSLESCRPQIEARRHRIALDLPGHPLWLHGDPGRLTQCICNLLDNAAKYTEPGGDIRIALTSDTGPAGQAVLSVTDSGIGIDAHRAEQLFEMFYRAGAQEQHSTPGLGLGLALVRQLIGMHGGEVGARSEGRGRGSTFWLRLPLAEGTARAPAPRVSPAAAAGPPASLLPRSIARPR